MPTSRQPIGFLATSKPDQSDAFYGDILGLQHIETSPFAMVFSDNGMMLRIQIVAEFTPASHTVYGWNTIDIATEMAGLTSKGVAFLTFDGLGQDLAGVWTTPNDDKIAWFKDPCGNILSLTQFGHA